MASQAPAFPVLRGRHDLASVTDKIAGIVLSHWGRRWWMAVGFFFTLTLGFASAVVYLLTTGIGIWGNNIPVVWAFDIANYIWWIALGMAGTFISAALLIARQGWRTSINRYAETMTVLAVAIAGLFPVLHLGRPWFFYWLFPYPNSLNLYPQWTSSLTWDFFAILAYLIFSIITWYVGLLSDLAVLRDRAQPRFAQVCYGLLALGWRNDARHWQRHQQLSLLLAGLGVPLVFSVHSMVALDLSQGLVPGWHLTIFPPYFVAGAIFSGFGLALVLGIPMRALLGLHDFITERHLNVMGQCLLAAGLVMIYCYTMEYFIAFYSGDEYEIDTLFDRWSGAYAPIYWVMVTCNVVLIQALWFRRVRLSPIALFVIGLAVIIGMWLERLMFIITSLYRTHLVGAWGMYYPTVWDGVFLLGSISLFLLLFLLSVRLLPIVSIVEMRHLAHDRGPRT
ncbi:MAG: polysulfide reductase NrfD [Gammaproteobacteria bacterium]|nr:polysulfide reductase NrfD [Gammaproteobacteria bacterium]